MTTKDFMKELKGEVLTVKKQFRCSPELHDKLEAHSNQMKKTQSWIIRAILKRYYDLKYED